MAARVLPSPLSIHVDAGIASASSDNRLAKMEHDVKVPPSFPSRDQLLRPVESDLRISFDSGVNRFRYSSLDLAP